MNGKFRTLAIDLGASSGRGIVFEFQDEKYSEKTVHRFPNGAIEKTGNFNGILPCCLNRYARPYALLIKNAVSWTP